MENSGLDRCLRVLSQRPPCRLTDNFNLSVWTKIDRSEITGPVSKQSVFSSLTAALWVPAGVAVTIVAVWSVWFALTSPDRPMVPGLSAVRGEVIDLACYYDDGGSGPAHAACAKRCILAGLPVGIKTKDGRVYLLVGPQVPIGQAGPKHLALKEELAEYAAQVVTIRGRVLQKQGLNVVENAQLFSD